MGKRPDPIATAPDPAAAVEQADEKATVLDDRQYIEDMAVYSWLRAHELRGRGHVHLVMGSRRKTPLLTNWPRKTFVTPAQAGDFLGRVARDRTTLAALNRLGAELDPPLHGESGAEISKALTPALFSGEIWATEVERPVRHFVSKASPAVWTKLRGSYSIDFAYIAGLEGEQWLRGYVPPKGRSGMTVASGFDVGQWSKRQLEDMNFPKALQDKLMPFVDTPFAHLHKGRKATPMTKAEVIALVAKLGPVPVLTKEEADLCDEVVFGIILKDAASAWDRKRSRGVPAFTAMPGGWQTVWLSRNYQEGPSARSAEAKAFRAHALAGEWKQAVASLRSYKEYLDRVGSEALKLEAAMPPEIVKPPVPGAAKPPPAAANPPLPGKP